MDDVLIIGGGVIGLSLAYELTGRQRQVRVLDRGRLGREASWAGAGILPPASPRAVDPLEQLATLSKQLHSQWARALLEETAIDTGYRDCGALHVARTAGELAAARAWQRHCQQQDIAARWLESEELPGVEPALDATAIRGACLLPDESQLRNPDHLRALAAACRRRGAILEEQCEVLHWRTDDRQATVETSQGTRQAHQVCVAAGPWSRRLLEAVASVDILPVRGQMVLFRCRQPLISHVVNEGPRYLVPRDDGRLLAGSTEEEVGFDKSTTGEGVEELRQFACQLLPALGDEEVERSWAGLRPASYDGFPYIGRIPNSPCAFAAAGHFRSGLHLSTGTARVLAQVMCGETPELELDAFRIGR